MAQTFKGKLGALVSRDKPYQHSAINIGKNEVVHLVNQGGQSSGSLELMSSRAKVKHEKLTDEVNNLCHQVNNLKDEKYKALVPSDIVKEACAMFKGKPGDLIEIFRGAYQHWAIYIGGQEVVNFVTDGGQSSGSSELMSSRAEVKREKLTDVVGHHRYQVNNLLDKKYKAREPHVIVKEACKMVGRELQYNVAIHSSEHFAIEMRYGKAGSRQFNGEPGDLIEISRGPYQHWAIYIGENEVVHFVTDGGQSSGSLELMSSRAKVKREKLTDVVGNDCHQVNNLKDEKYKAREPDVIVKEACSMVGRELSYNVDTYNCEHFAIEMRYGKAESRQVKAAVITAVTGAAVTPVAAVTEGTTGIVTTVAVGAIAIVIAIVCRALFGSRSST